MSLPCASQQAKDVGYEIGTIMFVRPVYSDYHTVENVMVGLIYLRNKEDLKYIIISLKDMQGNMA